MKITGRIKEMVIRAPGTYHHSIMVGNMAEQAAELVGADNHVNLLAGQVGLERLDELRQPPVGPQRRPGELRQ